MRRIGAVVALSLIMAVGCVGELGDRAGAPGSSSGSSDCTAGQTTCQGDDLLTCRANGKGWATTATCVEGCHDGACVQPTCVPDCDGRVCGDDDCGGHCGSCSGDQDECVAGACVCQPACSGKECGDDGCGGQCGACAVVGAYCDPNQLCQSCESQVCGVCDEIDVSQIVSYSGLIGDHANPFLRAEVFSWPITTELQIDTTGGSPCFLLSHFPGESWATTSNGFSDGAAMVACWHSIAAGGTVCQSYEWYSPDWNICRTMDWPSDRPVAHVLVSAAEEKRTAIKYYPSWPYNDVPADFDSGDVGNQLAQRSCQ